MAFEERLRELLPSLYRPEPGDQTLLAQLLASQGASLDAASEHVQHVLRAHWADSADKATFDAHYLLARAERGLLPANVREAKDMREILAYPYVDDLARLAAVLGLPPFTEPSDAREVVEEYRTRIDDVLDAYRLGLTTRAALIKLCEAALPEDMSLPIWQRRWPFVVEEPVAVRRNSVQVQVPEALEGALVAPLFRVQLSDAWSAPSVELEGTTPETDLVAATEQPGLERLCAGAVPAGVGIFYRGALAAGELLRLSPARRRFVAVADELRASPIETRALADTDLARRGPFTAVPDAPAGELRHAVRASDCTLWFVLAAGSGDSLLRFDGSTFQTVATGAPAGPYHALCVLPDAVLLGAEQGLFRCALYPAEAQPLELTAVPTVSTAVRDIVAADSSMVLCATADGLFELSSDLTVARHTFPGVPLTAAATDSVRTIAATQTALLLRDAERWFVYSGAGLSENLADFEVLDPSQAATAQSPLPDITRLAFGRDGEIWLATEHGLARYYVARVADALRTTRLEAYPDLILGAVLGLESDPRGLLRVFGADGLFETDGQTISQYDFDAAAVHALGELARSYPDEVTERDRGHFRFDRAQERWQRFENTRVGFLAVDLPRRSLTGASVSCCIEVPSVRAELGTRADGEFAASADVPHEQLVQRIKPDETRIVDGGMPAIPEPLPGCEYRYLQLEPEGMTVPAGRPWWSREGRLFVTPADAAPWPGHFRDAANSFKVDGVFEDAVFSYPPSASLRLSYPQAPAIGVRVRLQLRAANQAIEPAIGERVMSLLARAVAAGVPLELSLEKPVPEGDSV